MSRIVEQSEASAAAAKIERLCRELNNVVFGQERVVENLVIALLAGGHVLLEGLPGLGKTELVKGLARAVDLEVKRVQFTPDLLPGDITGNPILEERGGVRKFVFQQGPVFTNLLLADEINRASPKTQSALLEAMQEHRVTVLGETHVLPSPFFVLANQNPIELEGTYPLPEAQLDRFLLKLEVGRGNAKVLERIINNRQIGEVPTVSQVLTREELTKLMQLTRCVYLPDVVANFIARLVDGTHRGNSQTAESIRYGASTRAALALAGTSRARALMQGRINASFEDVQALALPALQHRIVLEYSAKLGGASPAGVIEQLLDEIPAQPRPSSSILKAAAEGR